MSRIPTITDKAPAPLPVFNQAIVANGFVYTSGSIAQDPATGKIIDGDIQAHTASRRRRRRHGRANIPQHRVIQNLSAVLEASGSSVNDVVEVSVFLADMGDFAKMNEVYQTYWGDIKPARTCVAVKTLPANTDVEIKCVAVVSKPWNIQTKL